MPDSSNNNDLNGVSDPSSVNDTGAEAPLETFMHLEVLLPSKVFASIGAVKSIVIDTPQGNYGLLPNRMDCVAALEPGILSYTLANAEPMYMAVDEGVMVKVGKQVRVSVRNAHSGENLQQLKQTVQDDYLNLSEQERQVRAVLARLESGFMRGFKELHL